MAAYPHRRPRPDPRPRRIVAAVALLLVLAVSALFCAGNGHHRPTAPDAHHAATVPDPAHDHADDLPAHQHRHGNGWTASPVPRARPAAAGAAIAVFADAGPADLTIPPARAISPRPDAGLSLLGVLRV